MKCFIGLGANLGERQQTLEKAAQALRACSENKYFRISPLYTTPALMPTGAPSDWNIPYLNAVAEIEWSDSARALLQRVKKIEQECGRTEKEKWAPRILDLDLIAMGEQILCEEDLQVPHPGILTRSFVLDPLKDLAPGLVIPGDHLPVVLRARQLSTRQALIMGIVNLTPDSFSDGGDLTEGDEVREASLLEQKIRKMDERGVSIIDLGAESTRPGALILPVEEEWKRLKPALQVVQKFFQGRVLRPLISVDTCKPEIAERALEFGVDWINDVSGARDSRMKELLKNSSCSFVLMHSLTVPADPRVTLAPQQDPVRELKTWLKRKMEELDFHGIDPQRMIFDPGIGFGKTAFQSLSLLKRIEEFKNLPCRILVGHSRKSFIKTWGLENRSERDAATLGISLELPRKGVDIIRVHDFETHVLALRARSEVLL